MTQGSIVLPQKHLASVTFWITEDEKAWTLEEREFQATHPRVPRLVAGKKRGLHRYEVIKVLRGDAWAEHWRDMGLAGNFKRHGFGFLSFGEDNVGELRQWADWERNQQNWVPDPPDLQGRLDKHLDDQRTNRLAKGHFGPIHRREAQ